MKQLLYILIFFILSLPTQAQFLEEITVKEPLSVVQSRAQSDFAQDAILTHAMFYGVEYQGIKLEMNIDNGKANGWVYRFYSASQDASAWFVGVKVTILGFQGVKLALDTLSNNMPISLGTTVLVEPWVDSPAALQGSKDGGAATFITQHSDARVLLALIMNNPVQNSFVPMGQYWLMRYGSSTDTLNCLVHAESGLAYRCLGGNSPQITSLPRTTGRVGEPYLYTVTAWGTPAPTFALTTSPAGMTINAASGEITWTPAVGQEGAQNVTVTASNTSGTDTQSFTITVQSSATGPRITSAPVTEAIAGKQYSYQVVTVGSPPPQYALIEKPAGMIIDAARGMVLWSPTRAHAGAHNVVIRATNNGGSDDQQFTLEVYTVPIISPVGNKITGPNKPWWYALEVDARPYPTFILNSAPANMVIDTGWGFITWTPDDTQLGTHVVLVQATNRAGTHQQSFEITVDIAASATPLTQPTSWKVSELWPAPVTDNAFVSLSTEQAGFITLDIIDALGRAVSIEQRELSTGRTEMSLPAAQLPNGLYLLRMSMNGETAARRFVVMK